MDDEIEAPPGTPDTVDPNAIALPWHISEIDEGVETEEDAMDFCTLELRTTDGFCSSQWGGKMYFLTSLHSKRTVDVTIETRWIYKGKPRRRNDIYTVQPKIEKMIGCDIPGPTNQRFERKILAAWFR